MCDAATLALASTAATVVGAGGSALSSLSAAKAQKQQQQEVLAWQQEQKRNREYAQARQEELRQEADASRVAGLEQLSGESQTERQKAEEERLASYLTGDAQKPTGETGQTPIAQADAALAGQNTSTTSDTFKGDLAAAINTATTGARERMKALAGVSSYGNSFGGLGTTNAEILNKSGADIDMFNEFRRGELGVHAAKSAVDPVQVTYTPSPLADAFSTAFQLGSQGLGNYIGGKGGLSSLRKTTLPSASNNYQGLNYQGLF
jgi:hypothetical protein